MSRRIVEAGPGQRLAIRVDKNTLLAVPPMRPGLPSSVRVKVFEYVLRRQPGLAQMVAEIESDLIEGREYRVGKRAAALVAEQPYSRDWNLAA